ncbi:tetratricopeptide repeat protein [Paludisphaera soli]|uniref:tetratricopeptide repeat protein n=1 Tax=Paludisphaera soli TaxID=2712865 RepID=UPI0013ECCE37|nr:tetratricopeptide repeat protein [Paludisphaera soli]
MKTRHANALQVLNVALGLIAFGAAEASGMDQVADDHRGLVAAIQRGNGSGDYIKRMGPARAAEWKRAAEAGDPAAQGLYGRCLELGAGVTKDDASAAAWYRKAAEAGDDAGAFLLAYCYYDGAGVEADPVEAVSWCRKAAGRDFAPAVVLL